MSTLLHILKDLPGRLSVEAAKRGRSVDGLADRETVTGVVTSAAPVLVAATGVCRNEKTNR